MRRFLLFTFAATIIGVTSCKKDDDLNDDNTTPPVVTSEKANIVVQVVDENGSAISGASVSINSYDVVTNGEGLAIFNETGIVDGQNTIATEVAGYYRNYKVIDVANGDLLSVVVELTTAGTSQSFSASTGGTVNIPSGGSVVFSPASIADATGNTYNGTVQVAAEYVDPYATTNNTLFPNSFMGTNSSGDVVYAENHGMLMVELSDGAGNELNIASGSTAEIHVPVPAQDQGSAPATIPLYHFDPVSSVWVEDGSANLVGNEYVGTVSHFSFWMCPFVYDHHFISGSIQCMGDPIQGVEVNMYNQWGSFIGSVTTNPGGGWSGSIPDVLTFTMEVEDLCGNVVYSNTIGPFTSSTSLGVIDVCNGTSANYGVLQGNLEDCNSNALTNSLLRVQSSGISRYLYSGTGAYNHALLFCSGATDANVMGLSTSTADFSMDTVISIAPAMNFGTLSVCGTSNAYCSFELDGVLHYYVPNAQTTFQGGTDAGNQNLNELRVTVWPLMKFSIKGWAPVTGSQLLDPSNGFGYTFDTEGNDGSTFLNVTFTHIATSLGDYFEGYINDTTFYNSNGDPRVLTNCSFRIPATYIQ